MKGQKVIEDYYPCETGLAYAKRQKGTPRQTYLKCGKVDYLGWAVSNIVPYDVSSPLFTKLGMCSLGCCAPSKLTAAAFRKVIPWSVVAPHWAKAVSASKAAR